MGWKLWVTIVAGVVVLLVVGVIVANGATRAALDDSPAYKEGYQIGSTSGLGGAGSKSEAQRYCGDIYSMNLAHGTMSDHDMAAFQAGCVDGWSDAWPDLH